MHQQARSSLCKDSLKSLAFLLPFSPLPLGKAPHRYHALASSQEASRMHHFAPLVLLLPLSCLMSSLLTSLLSPSPAASQNTADYCLLSHECCLHWEKTHRISNFCISQELLTQTSFCISNSPLPKTLLDNQMQWFQSAL